ncbi:MAG TPA: hypothetical protein VIN05_11485 [Roseovarius sp.]
MRLGICILLAGALNFSMASFAEAKKVVVRSGDHETFSRIVLYLPERTSWTIDGKLNKKNLTLRGAKIDWDTSEVFTRISKNRIKAVDPLTETTGLALNLNCRCEIDIFWHAKSMLVVDVKDPEVQNDLAVSVDDAFSMDRKEVSRLFLDSTRPVNAPHLESSQKAALELMGGGLRAAIGDSDEVAAHAAVAKQAIVEELARAVRLGLIDASESREFSGDIPLEKPIGKREVLGKEDKDSGAPAGFGNIVSYTSADPAIGGDERNELENDRGAACAFAELESIESWGDERSFISQVSEARSGIPEQGDPRYRLKMLDLARLYLYFGFGAEARQIVNNPKISDDEMNSYFALSHLIDGAESKFHDFSSQEGCGGSVAIFSIISAGDEMLPERLDANEVIKSFENFPVHLKNIFGPKLVEKFRENNKISLSNSVLRIMRNPRYSGPSRLAEMRGNGEASLKTESELISAVNKNTRDSLTALVELMDRRLSADDVMPLGWVELAGSYAKEQRGTDTGKALSHRYVRGLAAVGQYELAFEELGNDTGGLPGNALERTANLIVSYTTHNADDVTFLKNLVVKGKLSGVKLSSVSENNVAERLLNLGFPAEAISYLSGNADTSNQETRRLLRAKAALALGAPREAIGSLLGMRGGEVDALRAEAHVQLGDHMAASPLFRASGDNDGALKQAVLAENWQQAAKLADPDLARIIEIPDQKNEAGGDDAPIARGEALLQESEATRDSIEKLLKTPSAID